MKHSTVPPTSKDPASTPASPLLAGSTPITIARWVSRDGVHNSLAVQHIDLEPCDICSRALTVDLLTPALDCGISVLACPSCLERLREEALHATA